MSTQRKMEGGTADPAELPRGPNGRALCRWCSLEIPTARRTFCSDWCVEEWKLRSNPGYLREKVLERDKGVCAACGLDCLKEVLRIKRLRGPARAKAIAQWGRRYRTSIWDADHIVPVVLGGGECDLSNMQTLCLKCHAQRTAELRKRVLLTRSNAI